MHGMVDGAAQAERMPVGVDDRASVGACGVGTISAGVRAAGGPAAHQVDGQQCGERWLLGRERLVDVGLRLLALGAYVGLVAGVYQAWRLHPERVTLLALLVIETITMLLVAFARSTSQRDLSPLALVSTLFASYYFAFLNFAPGAHLVPEQVALGIQLAGMAWQLWAKLTLGRCFGLLPAHRGLVMAGPYRLVRHPIYAGYLISHVGFLLANMSVRNCVVFSLLYALQAVRVEREEAMLASSAPTYGHYMAHVRWRWVPGVW